MESKGVECSIILQMQQLRLMIDAIENKSSGHWNKLASDKLQSYYQDREK